jgi:acyl-coenzyme A thioesterase PaaI-like protein
MEGSVIKPGRTITVAEGRAYALHEGREKLIATMAATLMTITGRAGIQH